MELNSLFFILLVLPIFVLAMYFIKNNKIRNVLITVFSLLLYLIADPKYFILIVLIGLLTYLVGKRVDKTLYFIYLFLIVFFLCVFKYGNYFITNISSLKIIMPVGISFYVFTSISYVSDVYYKKIKAEDNIVNVLTYITFFPTVVSGPILRYEPFRTYLESKNISLDTITIGLKQFVVGLLKKIVIANQIAVAVNICFDTGTSLSLPLAWFGSICFMIQLYFDFSGYSDMAIGVARMIGFEIPMNFNNPYYSTSIQDFWRRWHISLSSWFRDYVYIPLGGSRCSTPRWLINIIIVWSLTGIWHGSTLNYLLWGLWNALFLILHKFIFSKFKLPKCVFWFLTQLVVMYGFTLFRANDLSMYTKALFGMGSPFSLAYIKQLDILYLWFYILLALVMMLPLSKKIVNKLPTSVRDLFVVLLLMVSIVYVVSGSYAAFIYAGF